MPGVGGRANDKALHIGEHDCDLTLPLPFSHREEGRGSPQSYVRVDNLNRTPFKAITEPLLLCGDASGALGSCPTSPFKRL